MPGSSARARPTTILNALAQIANVSHVRQYQDNSMNCARGQNNILSEIGNPANSLCVVFYGLRRDEAPMNNTVCPSPATLSAFLLGNCQSLS